MTAVRVVTDHEELDNSGQVTHSSLDNYVNNGPWVMVSGTTGPIPPSARKLKAGTGISIVDTGPGGDLIVSATGAVTSSTNLIMWSEIPSGSVNGINKDFTIAFAPSPLSAIMFFVNGVLQRQGSDSDYVMSSSTTIHINYDYRSGSNLTATYPYVAVSPGQSISWSEIPSGLVDAVNKDFTLAHVPLPSSSMMFFINGVLQRQGLDSDYTIVSSSIIHVIHGYRSGSNLAATYPY
jgi:hypothetical protein